MFQKETSSYSYFQNGLYKVVYKFMVVESPGQDSKIEYLKEGLCNLGKTNSNL